MNGKLILIGAIWLAGCSTAPRPNQQSAVSAAGGYVIQSAQGTPPSGEQGSSVPTADLNKDGVVTLDEIVWMESGGLSPAEMIQRIEATGLAFDLNDKQRKFLAEHLVNPAVIDQLSQINRRSGHNTIGK